MKNIIFTIISLSLPLFLFAQNSPSINFTSRTTDNEIVTLDDYLSKGPVYISFWALWCEPCKTELKILQQLYDKYSEKGVTILAINLDTQKSSCN